MDSEHWNREGERQFATYEQSGHPEALAQAITNYSRAVALAAPTSPNRHLYLGNLGMALMVQFEHQPDLPALARAIDAYDEAMWLIGTATADAIPYVSNLGTALGFRFQRTSEIADLNRSIACFEQAVELSAPRSDERAGALSNLAATLFLRYRAIGSLADLERVIDCGELAVKATPARSPSRHGRVNNLAGALHARSLATGAARDLERAISLLEPLMTSGSSPQCEVVLAETLATCLSTRYQQVQNGSDLERAVTYLRHSVARSNSATPEHASRLCNLGSIQRLVYGRTGALSDLEESLSTLRRALDCTAPAAPAHAECLAALGSALRARYTHTGAIDDLNECVDRFETSLDLTPAASPQRAQRLCDLSTGLMDRYKRTGRVADLDRACAVAEQGAQSAPASAVAKSMFVSTLGSALMLRYERDGALPDLDRVIECSRASVAATPAGALHRPMYLNNLGGALLLRFKRTSRATDLAEALQHIEGAVETATEPAQRASYSNNFSTAMRELYEQSGDPAYLERSIASAERALASSPLTSPHRPLRLNNLGNALLDLYSHTNDEASLSRGLELLREALEHAETASRVRANCLSNLATGIRLRYERHGDERDPELAASYFEEACRLGLVHAPDVALTAGQNWGTWALRRGQWSQSIPGLTYALHATERLLRSQFARRHKEAWLRLAQHLPANAAYAAARVGDIDRAISILEGTRTRMLTAVLDRLRSDLERLPALGYGEAYTRYAAATDRLARLEAGNADNTPTTDFEGLLRDAHAEIDAAIVHIREIPGYHDFFVTPPGEDVRRALANPIPGETLAAAVYLVNSVAGTLAIVCRDGRAECLFTELTEDELSSVATDLTLSHEAGATPPQPVLDDVLDTIGEKIFKPLVAALAPAPATRLHAPLLVLIPTGKLSLLPLHAARYSIDATQRVVLDDFAVTVVTSARALTHCGERLARVVGIPPCLLGIANPLPLPSGYQPLTGARSEVETLENLFDSATLLAESHASLAAVTSRLSGATHVHFACHGRFQPSEPTQSGLVLSGGEELTVGAMASLPQLRALRLVVLSACQTAVTDFKQLPEEAIGLPSTFVQMGAPGVVGSLWPVDDFWTAVLMVRFYEIMQGRGTDEERTPRMPSQALRAAQLWISNLTEDEWSALNARCVSRRANQESTGLFVWSGSGHLDLNGGMPGLVDLARGRRSLNWAAFTFSGV